MTDNATNMLLAQAMMARLHPPGTGWSAEDQRRQDAQRQKDEEKRVREEIEKWLDELRRQTPPTSPAWFRAIRENGWQVVPPQVPEQWAPTPTPRFDFPPPDFTPLNPSVQPPVQHPTYPGQSLPAPEWPPRR